MKRMRAMAQSLNALENKFNVRTGLRARKKENSEARSLTIIKMADVLSRPL